MSNQQTLNPFTHVDNAERQRFFGEARDKPVGTLQARVDEIGQELLKHYDAAGPDFDLSKVDLGGTTVGEKVAALVGLHNELAGYQDALTEKTNLQQEADKIRNRGGGRVDDGDLDSLRALLEGRGSGGGETDHDRVYNAIRDDIKEREGYDLWTPDFATRAASGYMRSHQQFDDDRILNVLFQTTDGWAPESVREPGVTLSRRLPIQTLDIIPRSSTMQEKAVFNRESVYTNNAAEVAEGAAAPELELQVEQVEEMVRKIAGHIPVTREELEDEPQSRGYLVEAVPFMVRQRLDRQVTIGNGTAPNLRGITSVTGLQDQDFASNRANPFDTALAARDKVSYDGESMPTHYLFHPDVWRFMVTRQVTNAGYYYGRPMDQFVERLWGLPVIPNRHLSGADASGSVNGLCGSFLPRWIQLLMRRELETEFGMINDDWVKDIMRIKSSVRAVLVVRRPQSFVTITMP